MNTELTWIFQKACRDRQWDTVRSLLKLKGDQQITLFSIDQSIFQLACQDGCIDVVKHLFTLENHHPFDIIIDENTFQWACENGYSGLKYLLSIKAHQQNTHTLVYRKIDELCKIYYTELDEYMKCAKFDHHVYSLDAILNLKTSMCEACRGTNTLEMKIYINKLHINKENNSIQQERQENKHLQNIKGYVFYKNNKIGLYDLLHRSFFIVYEIGDTMKLIKHLHINFEKNTKHTLHKVATALKIPDGSTMTKKDIAVYLSKHITFGNPNNDQK